MTIQTQPKDLRMDSCNRLNDTSSLLVQVRERSWAGGVYDVQVRAGFLVTTQGPASRLAARPCGQLDRYSGFLRAGARGGYPLSTLGRGRGVAGTEARLTVMDRSLSSRGDLLLSETGAQVCFGILHVISLFIRVL